MQTAHAGPQVLTTSPVTLQAVNLGNISSPTTRNRPTEGNGASGRICSSTVQALLGLVLIVFGIVVVSLIIPEPKRSYSYSRFRARDIDQRDRVSWGIWCGAVFILTSVFGLCSRKNQALISLYMAFSIISSVLACCGIILSGLQLSQISDVKQDVENDLTDIDSYNYRYNYRYSYGFRYYQPSYDDVLTNLNEVKKILTTHLASYAIMLTCFVVEFIISIVGASFTCNGLDCCTSGSTQPVIYYQTQVPQFSGHSGQPGQLVILSPTQQYPFGMPLPAGTSMVQTTPVPHQAPDPMVWHAPPQNQYVTPPPRYKDERNPHDRTFTDGHSQPLSSAPPTYDDALPRENTQASEDDMYITVME